MGTQIGGGGKGKGKRDDGEQIHKKCEKSEMTRYEPHGNDRKWDAVGRRCKLVCDSQVIAGLLNGTVADVDPGMKPLIDKFITACIVCISLGGNHIKTRLIFRVGV